MEDDCDYYRKCEESADNCKILFDMFIGFEQKGYAKPRVDDKTSKARAEGDCSAQK